MDGGDNLIHLVCLRTQSRPLFLYSLGLLEGTYTCLYIICLPLRPDKSKPRIEAYTLRCLSDNVPPVRVYTQKVSRMMYQKIRHRYRKEKKRGGHVYLRILLRNPTKCPVQHNDENSGPQDDNRKFARKK